MITRASPAVRVEGHPHRYDVRGAVGAQGGQRGEVPFRGERGDPLVVRVQPMVARHVPSPVRRPGPIAGPRPIMTRGAADPVPALRLAGQPARAARRFWTSRPR